MRDTTLHRKASEIFVEIKGLGSTRMVHIDVIWLAMRRIGMKRPKEMRDLVALMHSKGYITDTGTSFLWELAWERFPEIA